MEQFNRVLLDVWREACRHIEIAEATDLIAQHLFQHLPIDALLLRLVDLERSTVDTLALSARDHFQPWPRTRAECTPEALDKLLQWSLRGEWLRADAATVEKRLPGLLPAGVSGEVLLGPLNASEGPPGALVAISSSPQKLLREHEQLFQVLLEPFTVALENDRRLHELIALREKVEAENRSLLTKLGRNDLSEAIVGAEAGLRPVMERVELIARADIPVLILGETGSGKEVVARAIHKQSRRANGPFLRVNCGAIPPELVDSELFGHERGSFTGATNLRKGWFERADRGTLFLDECGELTPAAQVRLLRILQDGTFERVGGEKQIHVDVRVVAATNRDLQAMVTEGTFRQDLWYRLAVFPVHLPPLRERPEDVPALASHFALRAAKRFGLAPCMPTPHDMGLLAGYAWPGNVRELAAVIERAAILGNGKSLEVAPALGVNSATVRPPQPAAVAIPREVAAAVDSAASLETIDGAMRRHIEQALQQTHGRIEGPRGAALLLKINPHTLRARMRKLKIPWRQYREA